MNPMNRTNRMIRSLARFLLLPSALLWMSCAGPGGKGAGAIEVIRLVDRFAEAEVAGSPGSSDTLAPERIEWLAGKSTGEKLEWLPASGASGAVVKGRYVGRTTRADAILDLGRTPEHNPNDILHSIEIRAVVPAGGTLFVRSLSDEKTDFEKVRSLAEALPWPFETPLIAGDEAHTYTMVAPRAITSASIRHILIQPTDVAGADFAIESVRLIFRREHLASIPSGLSWQGLSEVYRETIVSRTPETISYRLDLPERARFEASLGTVEPGTVTFRVGIRPITGGAQLQTVLTRTVSRAHAWQRVRVDLPNRAAGNYEVVLSVTGERDGTLGLWGAPSFRRPIEPNRTAEAPPNVLVILVDTLRSDHLSAYGYERPTSPAFDAFAAGGVRAADALSQATWTKVSVPSIMTSLHPRSHTVQEFNDRLPASATTLAEVYRAAGYETFGMASIFFVGKFTNLHQGFEEFQESGSLAPDLGSKVARDSVDKFLPWLESHREVPFFALFHVDDPHDPFEPYEPYNTLWSDPAFTPRFREQEEAVRKVIKNPLMRTFGMPSRAELLEAGIDPEPYVRQEIGWYDGSIRALDVEIGRLLERLDELGLTERTIVAFVSDHGEEFLEHDHHFHGHTTYGELNRVPFAIAGPGVPEGLVLDETIQTLDLMPTLLELSGLEPPEGMQGRSLVPLFSGGEGARPVPAFTEKAAMKTAVGPTNREIESFAVVHEGWKLIHNRRRSEDMPEFELYRHDDDPLNLDDLAEANGEVVTRLAAVLEDWHRFTGENRLASDAETVESLDSEALEQLRALGYLQ